MRRLLPLVLAASSCTSEELLILPNLPGTASAGRRSLVISVEPESRGELALFGFDTAAGPPEPIRLNLDTRFPPSNLRITALFFERTLAELGLREGSFVLEPIAGSSEPAASASAAAVQGDVSGERRFLGWQTNPVISERLRELRVRARVLAACPRDLGASDTLALPITHDIEAMFSIDGRTALVIESEGDRFEIDVPDGGALRFTRAGAETSTRGVVAGFEAEDGSFWLGHRDGAVSRLVRSGPGAFTAVEELPARRGVGGVHWITGAPPGQPLELFVLHESGRISRYDGQWSIVVPESSATETLRRMLWLGPRELIAIGDVKSVFRVKDGVTLWEPLPAIANLDRPKAIGRVGARTIVSVRIEDVLSSGRFVEYDDVNREWVPFRGREEDGLSSANDILDVEGGFLFVGQAGLLGMFLESSGFCPSVRAGTGAWSQILALGSSFLLAGSAADNSVARLKLAPR